ncbi:MAG TPA: class I SAM-dependent methyltransferase [Stellaceae bacterium]|nr:class I SAM-dependent methyltransferase [Stellaceae bacterium]
MCCPVSHSPLHFDGKALVTTDGRHRYSIETGIPLFAQSGLPPQSQSQRAHFERVADAYAANLGYAHTQEYMAYLDRCFHEAAGGGTLGTVAELCCGYGEALILLRTAVKRYVGVDLSERMLRGAIARNAHPSAVFVQADATRVPLADATVDTVVMLGGIHHVPARAALFAEVARILKPGGHFLFREPVSDFFLWRALRWLIYRLSPMLDHTAERPLTYEETVPALVQAGFRDVQYRQHGLLGFCLFMNSDVLVVNRLFRFIPGIRGIVRLSTALDEALLHIPGLRRAGLQVIGIARKPG